MKEETENIVSIINERLLDIAVRLDLQILAAYVFGSFGTEHFRVDSDIDLGVLAGRPLNAREKMEVIKALDLPGGHVVDLVDLRAVDLEMQDIVISERRRIYSNPRTIDEVEDYEHRVWVLYLTLCDDRNEIIENIRKTGVIHGPDYIEKGRIRKPVHKTH